MQAEAEGRTDDARGLFHQAWEAATDDYEACVAAHYLARHQPTPKETLHWNQECLNRADLVADDRVRAFYPSLHVNMAKAYRDLGEPDQAHEHFTFAAGHIHELPQGQYSDWTRFAIAEGLRSTGETALRPADDLLADLLSKFCARADLKALGLIVPAYLGDLGTDDDRVRLVTALHMVHAARWLPDDEQDAVSQAISSLSNPTA
jgi:tetratricopeptide (TPR) repeat protein